MEKFRRVAEDTLEYYVTVDDPTVWSRPWTLMIPLKKTGEGMFEFACHEGNYGLRAILQGRAGAGAVNKVMRLLAAGAVAILATGCVMPQGAGAGAPITIQKQGSFAVGGKILGDADTSRFTAITATSTTRFQ